MSEIKICYKNSDIECLDSLFSPLLRMARSGEIDSMDFRKQVVYIGFQIYRSGDYMRVRDIYEIAHTFLPDKVPDGDHTVHYIEHQLGNIYTRMGNYLKAQNLLLQVVSENRRKSKPNLLLTSLNNLALAYYYDSELQLSLNTFRESLRIAQEIGDQQKEFFARLNICNIYLDENDLHNTSLAIDTLQILIPKITSKYYLPEYYNLLAEYYSVRGDDSKAISSKYSELQYAKDAIQQIGPRGIAKIHSDIAELYIAQSQIDSGRYHINLALEYVSHNKSISEPSEIDIYKDNIFVELNTLYARLLVLSYRQTDDADFLILANKALDLAEKANQLLIEEIVIQDKKVQFKTSQTDITDVRIYCLYELFIKGLISSERIDSFFLQSKSGLVLESMNKRSEFELLCKEDKTLLQKLELKNEKLRRDYAREQSHELADSIISIGNQIDKIFVSENTEKNYNDFQGYFIDYYIVGSDLYVINNFTGSFMIDKLSKVGNLANKIDTTLNLLKSASDLNQLQEHLSELYIVLLKKYEPLPVNISVITHNDLQKIPFGLLYKPEGRYLIQDHILTVRFNRRLNANSTRPDEYKISIACPEYGVKNQDHLSSLNQYPNLFNAKKEAEAIQAIFPQADLIQELNDSSLDNSLDNYDIFHFAGHALSNPYRGKIILGSDYCNKEIYGNDLLAMKSNNYLTVLSACESGVGKIYHGEGSFSLARALIEGGSSNVINSLWKVNDRSTEEIMSVFYSQLKEGESIPEALRNAKLDYLNSADGAASHPYYWGGFILTSVDDQDSSPGDISSWVLIMLGFSMIAALYYSLN